MSSRSLGAPAPVLFFDGDCALCNRTVHFILAHERRRSLRFAPLDGPFARAIHARHRQLRGVDSVIWVEGFGTSDERVFSRSDAALRVARYLGGPWRALAAARIVPRPWRNRLYDLVARHRHRLTRVIHDRQHPHALPPERLLHHRQGDRDGD